MARKFNIDLDTNTLDMKVSALGLAEGDSVTWPELVAIRAHLDRVLEQRERIDHARQSESDRRARA